MGPPLGGVLFEKLGFRAPFILSIAFASVDLIGRLLIIERAEAIKWLEKEGQPEVGLCKVKTLPQISHLFKRLPPGDGPRSSPSYKWSLLSVGTEGRSRHSFKRSAMGVWLLITD